MVGESANAMRAVKARIAKAARGMAPVLVRGESGTGKELVARAVHACSQRNEAPCRGERQFRRIRSRPSSALAKGPTPGRRKTATATFRRRVAARSFWTRSATCRWPCNYKLLRAIQERIVRPIGSTQEDAVDVRIVSATHKDLHAEVQSGR